MSKELSVQTQTLPVIISEDKLSNYLDIIGLTTLSTSEKSQFIEMCKAFQLDPFKREIYAIKYSGTFSIVVGYEVYLKRAERSGLLDGWHCTTEGSIKEGTLKAVCTIHRKDRKHPFIWEGFYDEFVQKKDNKPTKFWEKGRFMTMKCTISQAFRLCFSDELGGMPYTADELSIDISHEEIKEPVVKKELPQPASETQLEIIYDLATDCYNLGLLDEAKYQKTLNYKYNTVTAHQTIEKLTKLKENE